MERSSENSGEFHSGEIIIIIGEIIIQPLGTEVTGVTVSLVQCYLASHSPGLSTATLVDWSRVEVGPPGSSSTPSLCITYH